MKNKSKSQLRPQDTKAPKTNQAGADSPKTSRLLPVNKKRDSDERPLIIVGIGASAGGLEAFTELFSVLPSNTGMAFVVVQHLSPQHTSMLSSFIQNVTKMKVTEVVEGVKVCANEVYVIPPNSVVEIYHSVLHLTPMSVPHSSCLVIDLFLSSLAQDKGGLAIGVVLSGTGSDGAAGLKHIKDEAGITFVQSPATAKYDGMPSAAIKSTDPSFVLDTSSIARELVKIARDPKTQLSRLTSENEPSPEVAVYLQKIFLLLRTSNKVDFSTYKYPTIMRRLKRRMIINRIDNMVHYLQLLKNKPNELQILFNDLLINVTSFFRDPEVFKAVSHQVIAVMVKDREMGLPIRVWVAGCSTGEEVYSLAISILETLGEQASSFPIQIYGTDISEAAIRVARIGFYQNPELKGLSPERLKRFFVKDKKGYRIAKNVRDCCIFSIQDVTSQPPFARLDLLSCRNLLIYLDGNIQRRLMDTFYYALKPGGFLLLGSSETVASAGTLFGIVDKKNKIYIKKNSNASTRLSFVPKSSRLPVVIGSPVDAATIPLRVSKIFDPIRETERRILEQYAPAWVLLTPALEVVQLRGPIKRYLEISSGNPSWNITKLLRPGVSPEIRVLIHKVFQDGKVSRKSDLKVLNVDAVIRFDVEASLIKSPDGEAHCLLVFLDKTTSDEALDKLSKKQKRVKGRAGSRQDALRLGEINDLRSALSATQSSLQVIIDDQHSVNQEMQTSNEEVLSANEELQSTNEELETAKEELQSTNEELITLNDEVSNRNSELSVLSSDLTNVLDNVNVSIVMVRENLAIRRYTAMAGKLLNLIPSDVGRFFGDINTGFKKTDLIEQIKGSILRKSTLELESQDRHNVWYSIRIKPYHLDGGAIDGSVIMFINIDALKRGLP